MRTSLNNYKQSQYRSSHRIPKVTLPVFRVRCGTLNGNKCKECECIMEFPLIHFNVLTLDLLGYDQMCNTTIFVNDIGLKIQNVDTRFLFFAISNINERF